ncbi:SDR family NAD(P)-dependent oxidoreductase [Parolsenella catena]|uniref:SDR family NAD(P)-dependent oxidoreductase n=1 Tax=Parolsenella catena TaxID=2003188 RepID=UPI001E552892|nr:SDR family oxidoreductase [Parolsenella catena]
MNNWLNLEGEVCVVTGALGGMGVEICREFARNGANVVLLDLDEEKVRTAAAGLSDEFGIHAEGYRMDATNEEEVQAAVDATIRDFGRVDALVNTAGILRFSPMEDLPLSDWEAVIKVNLTGTFIASQRFGREMIRQGAGRLVHISTAASYQPETFSGVYSSTKAGVNMMSKMMAAEWGPYGVRSNCVCPCFVKTPMSANFYSDPEVERSRSRLIATRRIGEVTDIANAVMFLASTRSDFTTGAEIMVDGGFSNMMGDLTAKPGGRRAYAENYLKNKGVSLWTDEAGVKTPSDQ